MARLPAGTEKGPVVSHFAEGGPGRHMKARLAAGDVLVGGTLTEYARPSLVKIYRQAGFDFIYIETEHTLLEPSALADTVLAARDNGLPAIAKVPQLERAATAKLLDCGVVGIQLPRAESRDQIETLRDYMKFPPVGSRAAAPGLGNNDYGRGMDFARFIAEQDAESTLVVHIETRKGYENAAEIVSTPGVDMVYLGPGDFSVEMGRPGDWDHPEVVGPGRGHPRSVQGPQRPLRHDRGRDRGGRAVDIQGGAILRSQGRAGVHLRGRRSPRRGVPRVHRGFGVEPSITGSWGRPSG